MAGLTTTMTKLGVNQSISRAVPLSAAAGSNDFANLLHGLGLTPVKVNTELRSLVSAPSLGAPLLAVESYDKTTIIVRLTSTANQAQQVQFDVWADLVWSAVR